MVTKRQRQVLDFITDYQAQKEYAPSLHEIRKKFGFSSVSTAHFHVSKLRDLGYLAKEENKPRSIDVIERKGMVKIPLLGIIAAGQPIEAIQDKETIAVPKDKLQNFSEVYALRVMGSSMIDENIHDGDIILVKQQATAENGQKVVALIDNHEATLKKYYREHGHIRLQPANKNMEPIILRSDRDISIQGIVLDVIRDTSTSVLPETYPEIKFSSPETRIQKPYYEKAGFQLYEANSINLLASLPENSVDMVFADPPYLLSNGGFSVHAGKRVSVNKGEWDRSNGLKKDFEFHLEWIKAARRVLKPHGTIWISGTYHSIYQCGFALQAAGFHILNDIAWFKPNASPNLSCRFFTASHETIIWARKYKKAKHIFNYDAMKNGNWPEDQLKKPGLQMRSVWSMGTPKPPEKKFGKHPTQKPISLLERVVLASTKPGDVVLDPFTGSSTTGLAAIKYKRKFIGVDTDSKYLDLSIKRFKDLDGSFKSS